MNTPHQRRLQLRFLFDEHVNAQAMEQLQRRGVDVVSVMDVGLGTTPDPEIFEWARREGRIIVTRNYHDFAPVVTEASRQGTEYPGVLFCATSLHQGDVGGHVRALERWISTAEAQGINPVANTYGWLR